MPDQKPSARAAGPGEIRIRVDEEGCLVAYTTTVIPEVTGLVIFTEGREPTLAEIMEVFTPEWVTQMRSTAPSDAASESDDGR